MTSPTHSPAFPAGAGARTASPVVLAERQGVTFVASAHEAGGLRFPRRERILEDSIVVLPASLEEIRAADRILPHRMGGWPAVAPRPAILASALERLLALAPAELALRSSGDGFKAAIVPASGEERTFPVSAADALGLLAAALQCAPRGPASLSPARPRHVLLGIRPGSMPYEYRVGLQGTLASDPPGALPEIGLAPPLSDLFLEVLDRPATLLLVAGGAGSGRSRTLSLCAALLTSRGRRGAWIGPRQDDTAGLPWFADALSDWPFSESVRTAASDFVVVDHLHGAAELAVAARLAAAGVLVLAAAPVSEPAALRRSVERDLESSAAPAVGVAVLAQSLVRTVCRDCLAWNTLSGAQASRLSFSRRDLEEIERRGGLLVPSGRGCPGCAGTGFAGLTGVYELSAAGIAESLPALREDGWRKVLQGAACHDDVAALPGAHRVMRPLREVLVQCGLGADLLEAALGNSPPEGLTGTRAEQVPSTVGAAAHRPFTAAEAAGRLADLLRRSRGGTADPAALADLSAGVVATAMGEQPLSTLLLPRGVLRLSEHAVNSALIAARLAIHLGAEAAVSEVVPLALLHDAALVAAGTDPEAALGEALSEEAIDPGGLRFDAASALRSFGPEVAALTGPIRQVHELLSRDPAVPSPVPRPEYRIQAVALASLVEMLWRGPGSEPLADLHDLTPLVMEHHARRFGPALMRALLMAIPIFPIGSLVELSSGDLARVVSLNADNHFRPCVETAPGTAEAPAARRVVDLTRAPFLHIRHRVRGLAPGAGAPVPLLRRSA